MKNKYGTLLQATALGAFALAAVSTAQALPSIRITDGTTTITVGDGSGGDTSLPAGSVGVSTAVGDWTVVVTSGATKTLQGSTTRPDQHLDVRATTAGGPTTLTVLFSEDFFGPTTSSYTVAYSAVLPNTGGGATAAYGAFYSLGNTLFATTTPFVATPGYSSPGSSSTNLLASPGSLAASFSITNRIQFTSVAGGPSRTSSAAIDVTANVPDGGSTLALLGFAFAGFGFLRRKLNPAA